MFPVVDIFWTHISHLPEPKVNGEREEFSSPTARKYLAEDRLGRNEVMGSWCAVPVQTQRPPQPFLNACNAAELDAAVAIFMHAIREIHQSGFLLQFFFLWKLEFFCLWAKY